MTGYTVIEIQKPISFMIFLDSARIFIAQKGFRSVRAAAETVASKFGKLWGIVNNAGICWHLFGFSVN